MRRIMGLADIAEGLDALCAADPRLADVRHRAGEVPLRLSEPGFGSLVSIIVAQQVSRASAVAILGRLTVLVDPLTPEGLLGAGEETFRQAGLSRPKQRSLTAVAEAAHFGGLDLNRLCDLGVRDAMAALTAISGIGPWTAQVYLLSAAGHPDVFPAGDVALQSAVGHAFGLTPRPGEKALAEIAEAWTPWRGVASRLFWAYYSQIKGREGAPPS